MNNAGYVLGVERVGDIADSDIEGMFATNGELRIALVDCGRISDSSYSSWTHLHDPAHNQRRERTGFTDRPNYLPFCSDFKEKKAGHVINIGSIAGREPYAGGSIYTATKHAVNAFTGSLMRELVDTPIRVTEVQPGKIYSY